MSSRFWGNPEVHTAVAAQLKSNHPCVVDPTEEEIRVAYEQVWKMEVHWIQEYMAIWIDTEVFNAERAKHK